ncbi:5-methyltetrahydropteroyltriglutamate--homocysteine methyltransferase [Frondihabitans sp. 762G35]|uniref:5-methyltetrahydropteroyltriglutamate-- homocysteine S-methyltransferase n=1 Tax=Frondihabitans sp. 762G35 TaxID=1446794 RepID=UPI000D209DDD|nr:5-methyltetrahydropteroyltriglutamate--homocysteine S-methyltransferase [Frondihabitans sp. 762G35]ARC56572.1 5-methyltetrahydropteroyltriglutamate--homocysteine methyltransferase [Frondihabitans sp. 762G35]
MTTTDTTAAAPAFPAATILGYPRVGADRELKRAIESHWAGRTTADDLEASATELRARRRARLAELGLGRTDSSIPEDFSFYDQVLDAALTVGAVPARFGAAPSTRATEFLLARGDETNPPLEMTKWFDTNYHHLVPEISPDTAFHLARTELADRVREAAADGYVTRPVVVGPVTLLALSVAAQDAPEGFSPIDAIDRLVPVYVELLAALKQAGAEWVQLDEPGLVSDNLAVDRDVLVEIARRVYAELAAAPERPRLFVALSYGDSRAAAAAVGASGVEALSLDLVRGSLPDLSAVPSSVTVAGGVVDGRSIWRTDLGAALDRLEALGAAASGPVAVTTTTSLQHLPHDVTTEHLLDPELRSWLAFADQRVAEVLTLAAGVARGRESIAAEIGEAQDARTRRASALGVVDADVRARVAAVEEGDTRRVSADERDAAQRDALGLPLLPTTTIGSFPQTVEVRRARAANVRGDLADADYDALLRREVQRVIEVQEEVGLDVLVHGEPERNDMVQFFAEQLDGFSTTANGWVQSYGTRCTRPSILWGDVSRPAPMTVELTTYAASLTSKPVKGMLTGPVTILAWSFVRDDLPLAEVADQVALALRDEVADLEAAGIGIIQVDEPALRELLPLDEAAHEAYLAWSTRSFRLATSGVAPATQIHTHLCYSEFGTVITAIDHLDADVTSIEAARSRMEVVDDLARVGFSRGVGPGVYDIHSPRVPGEAEMTESVEAASTSVPLDKLWINPDCGLKTRGYAEVVPSLAVMVQAARKARAAVSQPA